MYIYLYVYIYIYIYIYIFHSCVCSLSAPKFIFAPPSSPLSLGFLIHTILYTLCLYALHFHTHYMCIYTLYTRSCEEYIVYIHYIFLYRIYNVYTLCYTLYTQLRIYTIHIHYIHSFFASSPLTCILPRQTIHTHESHTTLVTKNINHELSSICCLTLPLSAHLYPPETNVSYT